MHILDLFFIVIIYKQEFLFKIIIPIYIIDPERVEDDNALTLECCFFFIILIRCLSA